MNDIQVSLRKTTGAAGMNGHWHFAPVISILMINSQIVNIFVKESVQNGGRLSVKKRQMSASREQWRNSYMYTKPIANNW